MISKLSFFWALWLSKILKFMFLQKAGSTTEDPIKWIAFKCPDQSEIETKFKFF